MEVSKWKLSIQAAVDKITSSFTNFKKDGAARKTPEYKIRKLDELATAWKEVTELDKKLMAAMGTNVDAGYTTMITAVENTYQKYYDALMLLSDQPQQHEEYEKKRDDGDEQDMTAEIQQKLKMQEVRFDGINRLLSEIETTLDKDGILKSAWCKIKAQALNKYWERVLITHEEIAITNLPKSYLRKKMLMEKEYEGISVILQESIEADNNREELKVPRISIPKFSGDYFEWVNFRDLFKSTVIDNKKLSDSQRMHLLRTHLDGEAHKMIADLSLTDNDFKTAWARLTKRFENLKVIVHKYMLKLLTQPNIKNEMNNSAAMKTLLDTTDQILMALANLGRPVDKWDEWIIITVTHKFNEELKKEWEKRISQDAELPTWEQLKTFLEEEFRIAESMEGKKKKPPNKTNQNNSPVKTNQIQSNQVSMENGCPICQKEHQIFKCGKFKKMSVEERWAEAKKRQLCFCCLSVHTGKLSCKRENSCKRCDKPHSTWLHPQEDKKQKEQPKTEEKKEVTTISANLARLSSQDNTTKEETMVNIARMAKTSTGVSLNECMHKGAKQQADLFVILLKWRMMKVVFKADIEKMYRQIQLHAEDRKYHTIIWREDKSLPLRKYQMTAVTFGTAAAPFLATRTLKQIGDEGQEQYPIGSESVKNDFYVDDLISGQESVAKAIIAKTEIIKLLKGGNMKLRKWTSNDPEFLKTIPIEETEKSLQMFSDTKESKTLGLGWNPETDTFHFKVSWESNDKTITKRQLLSETSKLFDPSGWLAPVVLTAKLLMKKTWDAGLKWDEEIPEILMKQWKEYRDDIGTLGSIKIPRWIEAEEGDDVSLHGFCDGCDKAYAALVYVRVAKKEYVKITMIASKTRLAPKKVPLTTPKLELCGAELLTNLMEKVKPSVKQEKIKQYLWCDSMAALGWIKGDPGRWKSFVANRVTKIQQKGVEFEWNYVNTSENPADCASRGLMPRELAGHPLWWEGPKWLKDDEMTWQKTPIVDQQLEIRRQVIVNVAVIENEIIQRFSSWNRLVRVITFVRRWKTKIKGELLAEELTETKQLIIKQCQQQNFGTEIERLLEKKSIKRSSHVIRLNPILDADGLLRVGGRLEKSELQYETKHPILLPANHHVSKLIIQSIHEETGHGGPRLMATLLRKTYWVINGKRAINNIYKGCVICKRRAGKVSTQLMSDLPINRVRMSRPFLHVGVDYTGGMEIRSSRLRKAPTTTGYIALFICFSTKAIHLELVSDQSTNAFLAAFQRFTARRGLSSDIYSDNGTNLVGAANQLERELLALRNQEMASHLAIKGIRWHFIPPASPHKGGIWERNIGLMKIHLEKVLGITKLTFEEFGTVLCQIEASLNSRPICPMTEDPEDLNVLTPGHFLIGDALLAPPQPMVSEKITPQQRWKYLQLLTQHFWNRWSTEYLTMLQQRSKWTIARPNMQPGDIVLIKEDNLPPRKWALGRIKETHQGPDDKVRVVSVTTEKGETKRSVNKICPLLENEPPPINEEQVEQTKLSKQKKKSVLNKPQDTYWKGRALRPRPLKNMLWLALIALIILFGGGSCNNNNHNTFPKITKFKSQSGIYFEDLGKAGPMTTEWHIYVNIDLNQYYNGIKQLHEAIEKVNMKKLCRNTHHCVEIMNTLSEDIDKLKKMDEFMNSNAEKRIKRSVPFGFVGWAEHELFGVMNADNAEHIDNQFSTVEKNEAHLLQLIKNQTSLIDLTTSIMEKTDEDINQQYSKLGVIIANLANTTDQTEEVFGLALYMNVVLKNFEKLQSNLVSLVTDLHQGHVNPRLFTPDQFLSQLDQINSNMPTGSQLPVNSRDNLRTLYKLLRGKSRVAGRKIILDIILPLMSTTEFQIFHIIPIPINHGEHRLSIVPETEILMITLERDKFYQLNWNEYKSCVTLSNTEKMCDISSPKYNANSDRSRCERELLNLETQLHKSCRLQLTKTDNVWMQLQGGNEWIYSVNKEVIINMMCNNQVTQLTLTDIGLIELTPGCSLVQAEMTIVTKERKSSKGNYNFYPNLNLSNVVTTSDNRELNFTINHAKQFHHIHSELNKITQQTYLERIQHYTHFGIQSSLWLVVISLSLLSWIKRHELKKLFLLASHFMVTSSNYLITEGWQTLRTAQRSNTHRSMPVLTARGENVRTGHE